MAEPPMGDILHGYQERSGHFLPSSYASSGGFHIQNLGVLAVLFQHCVEGAQIELKFESFEELELNPSWRQGRFLKQSWRLLNKQKT